MKLPNLDSGILIHFDSSLGIGNICIAFKFSTIAEMWSECELRKTRWQSQGNWKFQCEGFSEALSASSEFLVSDTEVLQTLRENAKDWDSFLWTIRNKTHNIHLWVFQQSQSS